MRSAELQLASGHAHVHGNQRTASVVEDLLAVRTPSRQLTGGPPGRNLVLTAGYGDALHVHLVQAGFVRGVNDPSTVRRKRRQSFVEACGEIGRRLTIPDSWKDPEITS